MPIQRLIARHRGRFLMVLVVAALVAGALVATGARVDAFGLAGANFPPTSSGGWYTTPFVSGTVTFDVDGLTSDPRDRSYDERLTSIVCSGPGVSASYSGGTRYSDTTITVTVEGDHPGATITCTASYERREYSCTLFGCFTDDVWFSIPTSTYNRLVKIDSTRPMVTGTPTLPPNENGWYRAPGAAVVWSGTDATSGIASCTPPTPLTGPDGFERAVGGSCTDHAGLKADSRFFFNYDATPPTLAPSVSPSVVPLHGSATVDPGATDDVSGIDTSECDPLVTDTVGVHTVECRATDKAGNTAVAVATYSVGYVFSGFETPIDPDALNTVKAGRSIPLKWRVTDAEGDPVTTLTSVDLQVSDIGCELGDTADVIAEASGASGLQNEGDGYYQFNWSTPKSYASSCKVLRLDLGDGIEHTAEFAFVR